MLDVLSSKWTSLVIYNLGAGTLRYGVLKGRIEGISQKMLIQTLKQLERDGLIKREVTPSVPPIVEYSLTELGETLIPFMKMLKEWIADYYSLVTKSREEYDLGEGVESAKKGL
jgi:DNA-binding HxlR family transcriptional regulator